MRSRSPAPFVGLPAADELLASPFRFSPEHEKKSLH